MGGAEMFKGILLPIDLDDESSWRKAAPVAVDLCQKFGCNLHVMTVVPSYGMSIVGSFFPQGFEKKALAAATENLHKFTADHIPKGIEVQHIVAQGTIYQEIIKARTNLGDAVDLIVLASHRPELEDYLIGPNAARVLRHSRVSVLVVRE